MKAIKINKLSIEDVPHITPLIEEYRQAHLSLQFRDNYKEILIKYFQGLIDEEEKVAIVAKVNEEVAGIIVGTIDDNSKVMLPEKVGYVPFLTVLKKYRENGIGRKLLDELIRWFKNKNIDLMELYTSIDNIEAKDFWGKNGFEVSLERRFKEV